MMTDETAYLILEQSRMIRSGIRDLDTRLSNVDERLESLETNAQGLSYIVTTAIGSIAYETKQLKERVDALETGS
jgi:hypothetical protein